MALGPKGIDVRQTTGQLVFRAFLQTSAGALLGTGTTTLSLLEIQSDGTVKSYDFNDNTFKTTALTTATLAMTHRPANNGATTTGFWTAILSTLTGFTAGGVYVVLVNNSGASPTDQAREFQFGSAEGDLAVTSTGYLKADAEEWKGGTIPAVTVTGVPKVDVADWLGSAPLALSNQQVQAIVPATQKVDVDTIKTNSVVNAGTVTFPTGATLASTTNITAGTIANLTNLPAIPANWLTAAGIAAGALNGKGDWVLAGSAPSWYTTPVDVSVNVSAIKAKTDNLPADPAGLANLAAAHGSGSWQSATGFAVPGDAMALTVGAGNALVAAVAGQVTTDHGVGSYIRNTEPVDVSTNVAAIKAKTDNLPASPAAVGSAMALGVGVITTASIADGAITDVKFTVPTITAPATGVLGMIVQLWRWFFKRATMTSNQIKTYADDGTTVLTTQSVSDDGTTQDKGAAS
jgi:hypothetical protein